MKELKIGNHFWGIQRGSDETDRTIVNGKIISINKIRNHEGKLVKYIELDNGFVSSSSVNVDDIYESGDEAMNAYHKESRHMIDKYKSTINTIGDLIIFMFDNGVGYDEYYENYEVYQTVIEKAKELLGIKLKRKILCNHCRKKSLYKTCEKSVTKEALGVEYTYLEKYGVCGNCGSEICVPEYYEENVKRMRQAYRDAVSKKKGANIMEKEKKNKLHTPEEILNALHVIQDTCEYHLDGADEDCKTCPLCTMIGRAPSCTIRDSDPYVWDIDDDPGTTWRAFKK